MEEGSLLPKLIYGIINPAPFFTDLICWIILIGEIALLPLLFILVKNGAG